MKHLLWLSSVVVSLCLSAVAAVNVTVTAPVNNSQVGSPFNVAANATSSYHITGWHIYVDGNNVYSGGATNSINATINAAAGNHQVVTRAWDSSGAYGSVYQAITVSTGGGGGGGGNGLPSPPSWAVVYNHIEDRGNWQWCNAPSCAGGDGDGAYWMAQHQGSPSRDGSSMEFFNSGIWDNALWYQKLGANDGVHNLLWDFYIYVDSASQHAAQALEFDAFQFVHGYNYMIGSQCDYGRGVWDTWDEASGHWMPTSISCPKFSPNTWHHIQWYETTNTNSHQYTYVTLVVDGHSYPVNVTRNARNLGWGDNLGVQWQLDVNATGEGYHEWVDTATLSIW
ncbi:MAG: hypothetical protein WA655_07810 [Candidatus Korobacteraceae bacterium]